jgi:hypothetical protein
MRVIRRLFPLALLIGIITLFIKVDPAHADAVGLRLAPLEYQQAISSAKPQLGFIDVSNPSDGSVSISTSVQGFRQTNHDGDLVYYDSDLLTSAITPSLANFDLGPREAIRVNFTVNPAKLPPGGVYAVIFFQTIPANGQAISSYVSQSAKVGTLLILNNGGVPVSGGAFNAKFGLLQLGRAISGTISYNEPETATGLRPVLSDKVYSWGRATDIATHLVLPGATRDFKFSRAGSYLGIIPVSITDAVTHRTITSWVIACTGWYRVLVAILIVLFAILIARRYTRARQSSEDTSRPIDGLSLRG